MDIEEALKLLEEKGINAGLRPRTISHYRSPLRILAKYFPNTAIDDISPSQIKKFLQIRANTEEKTYSTLHMDLASFKFFYNKALNKNYDFSSIENPATPKQSTPKLFTEDEIKRLLKVAKNSRDRLMYAFMYHFEMSAKEIIELKLDDVKPQNDGGKAIRFASGELKKLPTSLSKELTEYIAKKKYTKWLFESSRREKASIEIVYNVFNDALNSAGINKKYIRYLKDSHVEHIKQRGADLLIDEILAGNTSKSPEYFVDPEQIDKLRKFESSDFDLKKLVRLCEELNGCYTNEWYFATAFLQRAIIDHVPPIFGYDNFSEVVSNYSWGKSFKAQMEHLQKFARTTADNAVHGMIRNREVLLSQTQIDFKTPISTLLNEILRILG